MSGFGVPKCCGLCGRWGNRAYRYDWEREENVCTAEHACRRRSDRLRAQLGGTPEPPPEEVAETADETEEHAHA